MFLPFLGFLCSVSPSVYQQRLFAGREGAAGALVVGDALLRVGRQPGITPALEQLGVDAGIGAVHDSTVMVLRPNSFRVLPATN